MRERKEQERTWDETDKKESTVALKVPQGQSNGEEKQQHASPSTWCLEKNEREASREEWGEGFRRGHAR